MWGVQRAVRHRDLLLVGLVVSGLLGSLIEPLLDVMGFVWHPFNAGPTAFTIFNRGIPLWAVLGYSWYYGATAYVVYRALARGRTRSTFWRLCLGAAVLDLAMESALVNVDMYTYYGNQPFDLWGFPLWWALPNGAVGATAGAIVYVVRRLNLPCPHRPCSASSPWRWLSFGLARRGRSTSR